MTQTPNWIEKRRSLRTEAEGMLSSLAPKAGSSHPGEALMHELLVHKVELEMQIDELRRSNVRLEELQDRYMDQYELAPVACISVDHEGLVVEVNQAGAALLDVPRNKLVGHRFSTFVATPRDSDRWHLLLMSWIADAEVKASPFVIEMARTDGATFNVYIEYRIGGEGDASSLRHLAMVDIGKVTQAQAEARKAVP